ncbi:hypothetical protein N8T08_004560 [Aspergillus melleus]|uniref:Uncharacterized protein n=1 Tax=Aspergillus melleus TaxID=138277 RepID=A0ACC3B488_9EURO|nr:hypothetical protein N8T08_004560 [Aspergillus melleus]
MRSSGQITNLLRPDCTDEEIDENVRREGITFFYPGGSAAMGQVVDTQLRVQGVMGLRVADASVLPVPITGYYQAILYALAEKSADLISVQSVLYSTTQRHRNPTLTKLLEALQATQILLKRVESI